jgi:hypothetical protein
LFGGDLDQPEPDIEDEHEDGEMSKQLENAPELENEFNGGESFEGREVVKGKEKKGKKGKRKRKKAMQDQAVDEETPAMVEEGFEEEAPKTKKPRKSNGTAKKRKRNKVEEEVMDVPGEEEDFAIEQQLGIASSASNGTSKKRKRKTVESEVLETPEDVFATQEEEETLEQLLNKARLAKNKTKATKSKKSRKSAAPEGETEELDDDHHPFSLTADMSELPATLERVKRKLRKSQEIYDIPNDENDPVAVLHQPLTPAHVHHRHDSNSQEEVEAQLQRDVQSATPLDVEGEDDASPKKPSKKALGKRKASEPLAAYSRKLKKVKDKAAGTPLITSFGFMPANKSSPSVVIPLSSAPAAVRRSTPAFTPINKPRRPSPARLEPEPEQDSDLESDFQPEPEPEEEVEPEPEVPKSSEKKKRRLPTGEENGKTPSKKGGKSKTPKASTPRATPISAKKGRLPSDDIDAITAAVEEYRDVNDMTQVEINSLVQKDAIKDGSELWKYVYEQVPGIPRQKVLNFCRRSFHNFERGGWTEEQDQELREVYERHPGKWKQIGETINRFGEDCRDRWRNYLVNGDNLKKSYWEKDEEKKLRAAVRACIKKVREDREKDEDLRDAHKTDEELIDWGMVSKAMGHTRSRLQCANKWKKLEDRAASDVEDPVAVVPVSQTSWRVVEAERAARIMSAREKLQLLYAIRDSGAGREGKIPWKNIQKENTQFKGKKMMLRICFRELRQHVPDHEDMKFKGLVETLIDAFQAAAPNEPTGFEKFGAAHQISLREKVGYKPRKKKGPDGKYLEEGGNGEGSSSPKKKRKPKKPKISEDYVVEEDEDEDVNGEAPSSSKSSMSVVPMDSPPLEPAITTDEKSSKKKKKRKLRDRMKDQGTSQSSAEDSQQPEAEVSDLEASLATLSNPKSKKNKRRQPISEVRVDESEDEEKPSELINPPQADEDEMDVDHEENYTAPGGPEEEEEEAEEDNALDEELEEEAETDHALEQPEDEEAEEDNAFEYEPEGDADEPSEIYEEDEAEEDNVFEPEPEATADDPSEIDEEEEAEQDNGIEQEPEAQPSEIDEEEDVNATHHDVESVDLDSGSSRDQAIITNGNDESDSDNESVDREFRRARSLTPDDYRTEKLGSPFSFRHSKDEDRSRGNGFANGDGDDSGDDSSDSDSEASIPAVVRRKRMASEEL